MRYCFAREIIEEGRVLVQKIKTDDNPADMLTKVVTTIKFNHCLDLINIAKVYCVVERIWRRCSFC